MAQPTNDGNIVKRTSQYLDNLEHDETTGAKGVSLYGTPDGSSVYRLKINSDGSINAVTGGSVTYKKKFDTSTTGVVYVGKAPIGTATSAAAWQISKTDLTSAASGTTTYAAAGAFTATWDNHATTEVYT